MMASLLLLIALGLRQAPSAQDTLDLKGKFYTSVFVNGPGGLAAADLTTLPPEVRQRLDLYLKRRAAFTSRMEGGAATMAAVAVEAKRRRIESGIVSLIDAPEIERLAAEYARAAHVLNDWESGSAGPLAEAAYAEDFLKQNASTPLAPYLYAFIAARQRAAFETMSVEKQKAEMSAAARKYRTFIQRARAAQDPVFKLLADDIDRVSKIYAASAYHPRDFNPDT